MAFRKRSNANRRTSRKRSAGPARRRAPARRASARNQTIKIVIEQPKPQPTLPFGESLPASVGNVGPVPSRKSRF